MEQTLISVCHDNSYFGQALRFQTTNVKVQNTVQSLKGFSISKYCHCDNIIVLFFNFFVKLQPC